MKAKFIRIYGIVIFPTMNKTPYPDLLKAGFWTFSENFLTFEFILVISEHIWLLIFRGTV